MLYVMLFKIVMLATYICLYSNGIKLNKVQESAGSAVGDKYPPGRTGCNPTGGRANQNL